MSLPILLIMVVVGVSAVGFAVHLSGGSQKAVLSGEDAARARFSQDFPDDRIVKVVMAMNGEGAVLRLADGAVGIVHNFGDRFVTRRLAGKSRVDIRDDGSGEITLLLHEFAWPEVRFSFGDADTRNSVRAAIGAVGRLGETG